MPKMSESGVYMILNVVTDARYVGSTATPFSYRWATHQSALRGGYHNNSVIQRAYDSDGADAFRFIPIEACPAGVRIEREQYWYDRFISAGIVLYNGQVPSVPISPSPHATLRPGAAAKLAKTWSLRTPDGTIIEVTNLSAYAREHGLTISAIRKVALGERPSHKGYTCPANPAPDPPTNRPERSSVCPSCGGVKRIESDLCRKCYLASDTFREQLARISPLGNRAANIARWGTAHLASEESPQ